VPTKKEKQPLSVTHPELATYLKNEDPNKLTQGSEKNVIWQWKDGHTYSARICDQIKSGKCFVCLNKRIIVGFNDLATTHPEVAESLVNADPTTLTAGSGKKLLWKCNLGHITEAALYSKVNGNGCRICANDELLTGFNDLRTKFPNLAKEANGWDPEKVIFGTNARLAWKCQKCGHQWTASANQRLKSGCGVCSNQKVQAGLNDLATTHPDLAKEAFGWDPRTVVAHSGKKVAWLCSQFGHIWESTLNNRSSRGDGCPICSGQKFLRGFNDLATTHPEVAIDAVGFDPSLVGRSDKKKRQWKCKKFDHIYESQTSNRTSRDQGCTICAGKVILLGFNDLATTDANLASEAFRWDPAKVTFGSHTRKKWKCSSGHIWEATVANRSSGNGCPTCAITGFSPGEDGWIYLLNHDQWQMYQIGITNVPDDRISRHKKLGWELLELRGPLDGHLTRQWETAILRMLKSKGADLSNSKIAGKFDGYSEAWSKSTFEAKSIKELMRLTEEFEEGR
jgi:hypothetical protein